jgi:uncharacterized protein YndB with AHSA1/START domain
MDNSEVWGLLTRKTGKQGEQVSVCMKREFEHDIQRVWAMLTDVGCLGNWLAPGTIDLCLGGEVKVDFGLSGTPIDSHVTAIQHESLLEYSRSAGSDPERPIRWELSPTERGTLLKLTLTLPDDDRVAVSCAGWDAHLEMLTAALEGINIHFPADRFRQAREGFSQLTR